jgi:hypothetical protein
MNLVFHIVDDSRRSRKKILLPFCNTGLIFAELLLGDEKGSLFSWNHQQNEVYEHVPLTGQINCISCPPDEEGVVVVG